MCLDNRVRIYKSSLKEVSNALFLAGNTNKALCSAPTLVVLDALDAITSRCRSKAKTKGPKKRDGGRNGNLNSESAKETMLSEMRV